MHATPETEAPQNATKGPASSSLLSIQGMTCVNCARHVTEAIQSVPGVRNASVDLEANRARVRWSQDAPPDLPRVIKAIEEAGFGAAEMELAAGGEQGGGSALARWQLNLFVGLAATLSLMLGEWVLGLDATAWFRWLSFALAGLAQAVLGAQFYKGAWNQLKVRSSNMDTLVALGSTTAFGYSVWMLFSGLPGHLYFMEAAAILTVVSTGHWLEARMSARASNTLRGLLELAPANARRQNADGSETEVSLAEIQIDNLIALRPGDRVPLDGKVASGQSAVDESMLTGESAPVDKNDGSEVYAGTINLNGRMTVRVTAMGEQTALAHVINAVQRAQSSRAEIQRLGDQVSSVFVPIVVTIAVLSGLWWGLAPGSAAQVHDWLAQFLWHAPVPATPIAAALITAAAILIVACPCAMGLATPTAIMAGSNVAAMRGILIRDGVALEKAGKITIVALDKTGTLTAGKPELAAVWQSEQPGVEPSQVLQWASTLAGPSTHPLSQAIARHERSRAEVRDWQEVRGSGLQAQVTDANGASRTLRLGSLGWMRDTGVEVRSGADFIAEWSAQGATIVSLASDTTLLGLFAVKDLIKPGAVEVVKQLIALGLKPCLVTGDHSQTAHSIARQAGIPADRVFAEVRPEQKAALVKRLQQEGERVAFVGDGINDAPALEQADLGIAVSRASDIARESADIILLNSEIEAVPESLGLARATLTTIKQNLFWAFFYNALAVPLAALGFINPMLCAAAMGFSDLIVIGNALRLRNWRWRKV